MPLELHTWKISGVSPLLQNNPAGTMGGGDDGGIKAGKKKYDDKEEAAIRTYKNADGLFVHPTAAFRSGILVAAGGRKIDKKAARTIIAGALFPSETEAILLNEKGKPIKEYAIHKCRVVVNKHGRPALPPDVLAVVTAAGDGGGPRPDCQPCAGDRCSEPRRPHRRHRRQPPRHQQGEDWGGDIRAVLGGTGELEKNLPGPGRASRGGAGPAWPPWPGLARHGESRPRGMASHGTAARSNPAAVISQPLR